MKKILVLFVMLLCAGVWAEGFFAVPYMKAPKIDGIIEETEWQCASCVSGFHKKGSKYLDSAKSFVYIGYDENNLYVAYKFYGDEKPVGIENDPDGDYWMDDALEFVISKEEKKHIWNQFIINWCGGFVAYSNDPETAGGNTVGDTFGTRIDINKKSACYISPAFDDPKSKEEKFWSGEISVSWDSFGMKPKAGDNIGILACRDRVIGGKDVISTSISYITISTFEIDRYIRTLFTDSEPAVQMTDYKYPGDSLKIYNPTDRQKTLTVTNSYSKGEKNISKTNDIVLEPGETKTYLSGDDFSDSFFVYGAEVRNKETGQILLRVKNDIINREVFSYNFSSDGIFTFNINAEGAAPDNFPTVDIKMKYNNLLAVYYLKKVREGEITSVKFDTKYLPHGNYILSVNIDGIVHKNIDIIL